MPCNSTTALSTARRARVRRFSSAPAPGSGSPSAGRGRRLAQAVEGQVRRAPRTTGPDARRCPEPPPTPSPSVGAPGTATSRTSTRPVGHHHPQRLLVELAHARLGQLVDEGPPFGEPPPRHPARQELEKRIGFGARLVRSDHHHHQGPLVPPGVGNADHGRLEDRRVGHHLVLQLDRRDPLAAGLDDVLGPVRDLHEAPVVEPPHVPRPQPAVVEPVGRRARRSRSP